MIGVEPDLTFLIDIDPDTGLARGAGAGSGHEDRFEDFGAADAARGCAPAFSALAAEFPARFRVIDGDRHARGGGRRDRRHRAGAALA